MCGAISGGVLCLGLANNVDLSTSGYGDSVKLIFRGLIKNDQVFEDKKHFKAATLFTQCKAIYKEVENKFGSAHCQQITGCRLDCADGIHTYMANDKINLCTEVSETVSNAVIKQINES